MAFKIKKTKVQCDGNGVKIRNSTSHKIIVKKLQVLQVKLNKTHLTNL